MLLRCPPPPYASALAAAADRIPAADVDLWKGALLKRNADKKAAAARRAIDCSADSPPAKRAKTATPGATATRPGTASELMGGWSQEDLLGASQG